MEKSDNTLQNLFFLSTSLCEKTKRLSTDWDVCTWRILSKKGHLSNDDCAEFAKYLVHNGTKRIVLGHLSRENNDPVLAFETTNNALGAAGLLENEDYQLYAAPASNSERMFKL